MKSFRSSSPQSNRSTTSSAPRRRSCNAPMFTMSERAVDALLAQELIVALYSLDSRRRKRFGMHHTHLKLTCFLSKKNRCLFYWFRHSLPPDLTVTKILYTNPSLKARGGATWNIPTFGKGYRALGGPCAFLRASEGFWSMFCRECECRHPVSSSNSICKSPHSSRGHFHPRHFPWRTKSQRRPSAIA